MPPWVCAGGRWWVCKRVGVCVWGEELRVSFPPVMVTGCGCTWLGEWQQWGCVGTPRGTGSAGVRRCCAGLRCAWWPWGWDVGAARVAVSPPKVSVCPQRAPGGPTVGPAATPGKLRQGALCPWRRLCIPGCMPAVVWDPWQQGGFCGCCVGMRTRVVQVPAGLGAVVRGRTWMHSTAWAQVCGCGGVRLCRGDWGWVCLEGTEGLWLCSEVCGRVQGVPGWSYTCRVVRWCGCPQTGCVPSLWVTPRALGKVFP